VKSLLIAFSTLTIFPVPTGRWSPNQLKNSVIFYPLVGAFLGGLLALILKLPLSIDLLSLLVLLFWVLLTMAFHLDGLGDCLDGWFGGRNPKERRRIMKDAAMGVYGVTGIVLLLLFKYVLLEHLFTHANAWKWLIAIPAAARYAVVFSCMRSGSPPGNHGLGSKVTRLSFPAFCLSSLMTLGLFFLLKWETLGVLAVAITLSVLVSALSKNRIGGLTGDGMGATIEITEVCLLFFACLRLT
jgi:adenosylcobinamide-GDP ribazoletransferase